MAKRKGRKPVQKGKASLPKRKGLKKSSAPKTPKFSFLTKKGVPRKDERGRFMSKEDWALRSREVMRRLASKVEREQELARQRKVRQKEVARLRDARHKRTRTKSGKTKAAFRADTEAQELKRTAEVERDTLLIKAGFLPEPTEVQTVGKYRLNLWRWYGPEALDLASDFLRELRNHFDNDTMGRVAIGTGYGKESQWVGTRTLPVHDEQGRDDLWWAMQRLTSTVSGKAVVGSIDEGLNDVWVEVELILPK